MSMTSSTLCYANGAIRFESEVNGITINLHTWPVLESCTIPYLPTYLPSYTIQTLPMTGMIPFLTVICRRCWLQHGMRSLWTETGTMVVKIEVESSIPALSSFRRPHPSLQNLNLDRFSKCIYLKTPGTIWLRASWPSSRWGSECFGGRFQGEC